MEERPSLLTESDVYVGVCFELQTFKFPNGQTITLACAIGISPLLRWLCITVVFHAVFGRVLLKAPGLYKYFKYRANTTDLCSYLALHLQHPVHVRVPLHGFLRVNSRVDRL
jgi:hypothetical protein